jgi:hypothetical protein
MQQKISKILRILNLCLFFFSSFREEGKLMSPVSATFRRLHRQKLVVTGEVKEQNKLGVGET